MMTREAVLLTGGASRRMGQSKANLVVDGESMATRIARELTQAGWPVTVLGREPLQGHAFQPDVEIHAGPLQALRRFEPSAEVVFVAACDMPLFRGEVAEWMAEQLNSFDAVIPRSQGKLQPLAALYRRDALRTMREQDTERLMEAIEVLRVKALDLLPFPPKWIASANTPEELHALMSPD